MSDMDPWEGKHIYAQDGWCWYKHVEEPIVTLQQDDEKKPLSFDKGNHLIYKQSLHHLYNKKKKLLPDYGLWFMCNRETRRTGQKSPKFL